MSDAFTWPESRVWMWTGSATASALVGLATDLRCDLRHGVESFQTLDGAYHQRITGQQADLTISALYTPSGAPLDALAHTAVHLRAQAVDVLSGSASITLWSGTLHHVALAGQQGELLRWSLAARAHSWSSG